MKNQNFKIKLLEQEALNAANAAVPRRKLSVLDSEGMALASAEELDRLRETKQELTSDEACFLSLFSDKGVHAGFPQLGGFPTFLHGKMECFNGSATSNDFLVEDEEQTQEQINVANAGAAQAALDWSAMAGGPDDGDGCV